MTSLALSFKIPYNKNQKNTQTINPSQRKYPLINQASFFNINKSNSNHTYSQFPNSTSLQMQNQAISSNDNLIKPYKDKQSSLLITERPYQKKSSFYSITSSKNSNMLITNKTSHLYREIQNEQTNLSNHISPAKINKSLEMISPLKISFAKHLDGCSDKDKRNISACSKTVSLNNQPLPSLVCRKEIKNIPIIANYPDLFNNVYSTNSEKERYYRLLEAFLKLKSMIEIDSRKTFKYFKEFLYKHGITNKAYYTNEYLLNLADFIRSDFSSLIDPNKNITQNLCDILSKGKKLSLLKRNNTSSYISPLIKRDVNQHMHNARIKHNLHKSVDDKFYIFPLPQQSQVHHEKVILCRDNNEMKHMLSSEFKVNHKDEIDLQEGMKLYNLINTCSKDKTKFIGFSRNYIYSNKILKYKLLDKDKQILNQAKRHHKITEYALLSSLNKNKANLFKN